MILYNNIKESWGKMKNVTDLNVAIEDAEWAEWDVMRPHRGRQSSESHKNLISLINLDDRMSNA